MSARRHHRGAAFCVALALALGLSACGVKSVPKHPEGSTYPQQYPASGNPKAASEEKSKQGGAPATVPQYDYPNRPPPR